MKSKTEKSTAPTVNGRLRQLVLPLPTEKEWMVAKDLLSEVMDAHSDPDDSTYNECDKAGEECYFCELARSIGVITTREKRLLENDQA